MRILVDTNIFVRAAQPAHPQHQRALAALKAINAQGDEPCIVAQMSGLSSKVITLANASRLDYKLLSLDGGDTLPTAESPGESEDRVASNMTPSSAGQVAAWTIACRDEHLRQIGRDDIWSAMRAIGVSAIEVMVHFDGTCPHLFGGAAHSLAAADGVRSLRRELESRGVQVAALCLLNEFDHRADEEVDFVGRMVDAAIELGVPALRLDFLPRRMKDRYEDFLRLSIDVGRRIVEQTRDAPVRFGVENHVTTTNRLDFLRSLFSGVNSPNFGLTLDTANFYWFGHPLSQLYDIYREFAPVVWHTHCKSIGYPESEREKQRPMGWEYGKYACSVDRGDIDFRRVVGILKEAGYQGSLCIENESLGRLTPEERRETLTREAAFLRAIVAVVIGQ